MPSITRPLGVAGASAVLGVVGLVATFIEFRHAATVAANDPEGLVTGFAAVFALTFLVGWFVALGEAGLLAAVVLWADPGPWAVRLLAAGAGAGGLATLPRIGLTVGFVTDGSITVQLPGVWWLFAVFGVFCSGPGVLLYVIEPLPRRHDVALRGVLLGVVLVVVAGSLWQLRSEGGGLVFRLGLVLSVLGVFSAGLGTVLTAIAPVTRTGMHLLFLVGIVCGLVVSVLRFLAGAAFMSLLIALPALVTLWACWLMVRVERRPCPS